MAYASFRYLLILIPLLLTCFKVSAEEIVNIGVLSHRGDFATLRNWSPTADYLSQEIDEVKFVIVPLDFDEIDTSVAQKEIDFLLVNPGIYVSMEVRHRISRIATMNNLVEGQSLNTFGGVIFTARKNQHINELDDLKGRSLMAVDRTSLGGFQMAWRELRKAGIDPFADLSSLTFGGIHDEVVRAVVTGKVDVGTVRTGILKSMAAEGLIDLAEIKILNPQTSDLFPLAHSTTLYPEWPFSKLQHTPNTLAQRVAIALLKMSELEPAAQWGDYAGWTVPLDYQPVHDLLRELELPPYDRARPFTLTDVFYQYSGTIVAFGILFLVLATMTAYIYALHRKLEESKHLLEQQHVQILDSVADGIYGVDTHGNSTFINRAMMEITGWNNEDMIGRNQHEILHHTKKDGSPHPPQECPVYKTFVDDKARFVEEDLFWKKDGSSFPVEYSSNPVKDENGRTVGSVVVFRDISLKKKSQEAARQYQTELAHVARLSTMGEMASGLAHELNQPLTAIATNADACIRLIEARRDQEKVLEVLEKISVQARHAGEIIRHLRKFVRKEEPEMTPMDINKSIREVLLLVQADIEKAHVKINLELADDLPKVIAQHIHIDQVMINLVRNAIEAMSLQAQSDRQLTILTLLLNDNNILVRVEDSGPGLSEEIKQKLFTPFTTTKQRGMGLGLSLSQGIISAHKGKLYVESSDATGTVFCFTLPITQEKQYA